MALTIVARCGLVREEKKELKSRMNALVADKRARAVFWGLGWMTAPGELSGFGPAGSLPTIMPRTVGIPLLSGLMVTVLLLSSKLIWLRLETVRLLYVAPVSLKIHPRKPTTE